MSGDLLNKVEEVLEQKVRPMLGEHQGDIEAVAIDDGVLKVRFLGTCSNCPSASLTLESLVSGTVKEELPEIKDVVLVTGVSDDTWNMAKQILKQKHSERKVNDNKD